MKKLRDINDKIERFLSRFDKSSGCWVWTGSTNNKGYGDCNLRGPFKSRLAHRVMYEIIFGPIPEGLHVCHRCDNPPCANPEHLFLGTRFDNMQDASRKGRINHIKFSEHQLLTMRKMAESGMGNKGIAKKYDVDESVIKRVLGPRPHPQKKLFTDEQIADIIRRHQANETHTSIGVLYDISDAQVIRLLQKHNAFIPYGRSRWRKPT